MEGTLGSPEFIVSVRRIQTTGNIKALVRLTLVNGFGEMVFPRFRLMQKTGGGYWLASPQESFVRDNKKQYLDAVYLPEKLKQAVLSKAVAEYERSAG